LSLEDEKNLFKLAIGKDIFEEELFEVKPDFNLKK
jgi:hypothetical protein